MGVEGRAALVTGAGSGIGQGIARHLLRAGARVCVLDLNAEAVERTVAELRAGAAPGERVLGVTADVTSAAQVGAARDLVVERFGAIDVLVNNAGVIAPETEVTELEEPAWERLLTVNLTSQFLCCRAVAPVMKARGHGRIVNIASRSWLGGAGLAAYAAAKGGVVSLTRSLAMELGRHGITVNCISPSLVVTPLFLGMPEREREADLRKAERNPVPRAGTVDDVAHAALFFAADEAGFVTGQHLYVSGGADLLTSGTWG